MYYDYDGCDWRHKSLPVKKYTKIEVIISILIGLFLGVFIGYGFLNFIIGCKSAGGFLFGDCS